MNKTTIDHSEIQKFNQLASKWWDVDGEFGVLHRIAPLRIAYIKEKIIEHFGSFYDDINILDVGCGGGLVTVPMRRLGAKVTGIDAGILNIEAAKSYASDLDITYICTSIEEYNATHDVILCLEIIEHVQDLEFFVKSVEKSLNPGGIVIFSTINRTKRAYLEAILCCEYLLRWTPIGTHEFAKFVKPSEMMQYAEHADLTINEFKGLRYNIMSRDFELSDDISVNYFAVATKTHQT